MNVRTPATPVVSRDWVERYLRLLGRERAAPSYAALAALMRAQKQTVVFENITAILRRLQYRGRPVPPIDHDALLRNWEQRRGGGVCFEITDLFLRLLIALGYRATMVLAGVRELGNHRAIVVELDGERYLVDVGSSFPVFAPIPLREEHEVCHAGQRLRFRAGEGDDTWLLERAEAGAWLPVFWYDLAPLDPVVRETGYQRLHDPGYAFVVSSITIGRCTADAVYKLAAGTLTVTTASGGESRPVSEGADHERLLNELFELPGLPVATGIEALQTLLPPV